VLAVLAAICLIGAFTLLLMLPPMLSLAEEMARVDQMLLVGLQDAVRTHLPDWVWQALVLPLLGRPGWLLPLCLGIVFAGAAVSTIWGPVTRSRHRRG